MPNTTASNKEATNMQLNRPQSHGTSKEQEQACCMFYLEANVNQTKWGILLFIMPLFSFIINDYILFGFSLQLAGLAALRTIMLITAVLEYINVKKSTNPNSYDQTIFIASSVLLICGGIINFFRPENFVVQAILTSISIFVLYLVIPFRFQYQVILGTAAAIGEAAIIMLIANPANSAIVFTIVFSLVVSNVIAAFSSWQMQAYRRKAFSEHQKRMKIQEDLEKNNLRLEELVAEKTVELKRTERLAAIGSTASMVGHDLRNPLTAISGAAYYLKKKYSRQLDGKGVEMLDLIQNNVKFSDKIISDLLDYSIEMNLEKQKIDLSNIIEEALTIVKVPPNIQVSVINQKKVAPTIEADSAKMKRVFVNLTKNAVDAMPNGGKLEIKTENLADQIQLVFADNGQGISDENQKNLFQPLFTTKAKGMGFGLAICQRIIEAHKGKIFIQSTLGKGTTVIIELPTKQ
jgi:signal transduction histidine kinase